MNVLFLYFAALIISLLLIPFFVKIAERQKFTYYPLMSFFIAISNLGYTMIAISDSMRMALMANTLTYLGGIFLPIFLFFELSKTYKINLPSVLKYFLFFLNCAVVALSMLYPRSQLFHKSVTLNIQDGVSTLTSEKGPLYYIFTSVCIFYIILISICIIYAFRLPKSYSYKNTRILFAILVIMSLSFIFKSFLQNFFIPLLYDVCEILLLILMKRLNFHDVSNNIVHSIDNEDEHGYIMLDLKMNYIGSNATAQRFFPELNALTIDRPVTMNLTPNNELQKMQNYIYMNFIQPLLKFKSSKTQNTIYISKKNLEIKCVMRYICYGAKNKKIGYMIELFDDTIQQEYIMLMSGYNDILKKEVDRQVNHIRDMQNKMILGIADLIENRDNSTGGHVKRTSGCIAVFIEELKKEKEHYHLTDKLCDNIVKAAPLHDLGKIAVEDSILKKPGRFTKEEFEQMKNHAKKGAEIVGRVLSDIEDHTFVAVAENIAHYHHEKWNGEGYPEGLSKTDIPIEARIMALADVFDALVSSRCYKGGMVFDDAFGIIENSLGTHFDPELGQAFLRCRPQIEIYYRSLNTTSQKYS